MARYQLRDPRAARGLKHVAGAFRIAGRLFVHEAELLALERARRTGPPDVAALPHRRQRTTTARRGPKDTRPKRLDRGWWKDHPAG